MVIYSDNIIRFSFYIYFAVGAGLEPATLTLIG